MPTELHTSFDELVTSRQELQQFCVPHYRSLARFQDGISFKLNLSEPRLGRTARHLSSTATCIESLLDCPVEYLPPKHIDILPLARDFALSALGQPQHNWLSDGSARIYCRCRTLPLIVNHVPRYSSTIRGHLERILAQLMHDPSRLAIGEASGDDPSRDNWYPPNAFHTYWTLYLLHTIEDTFPADFQRLTTDFAQTRFDVARLRQEMLLWAQQSAGKQIALHAAQSSVLDSDQLAWSLGTLVKFNRDIQADLAQQDFIKFGFKCLFDNQTAVGIWRTGAPLFHYQKSGNAYCYVFETFTALLKSALTDRKEASFLRAVLRPYMPNLLRLWIYATSTKIPLNHEGEIAWSSGHRPNRKEPESWATASVYSFAQCLRRLIGIWTRETAATMLKVSSTHVSGATALEKLANRGSTWTHPSKTAANQLIALFVNPVCFFGTNNKLEPDGQVIVENQARAAILFGPPGTSKTTLSRCVAEAIGWDYVELHASHFVADGLPNVQRTADMIFSRLLQLDRTVILFDEIDELVRAREKEPDAFGRFLTTSMLPKLAELWKRRKVIYFIATNHISFFDPAVIRAQRFDALIHVAPPSLSAKLTRLREILKPHFPRIETAGLTVTAVQRAIDQMVAEQGSGSDQSLTEAPLPPGCNLAKLLLLRWDQIQELASTIRKRHQGTRKLILNRKLLENVLADIADQSINRIGPYLDFRRSAQYEQHDFSKVSVWRVSGEIPKKHRRRFAFKDNEHWYTSTAAFGSFNELPCKCVIADPGVIRVRG